LGESWGKTTCWGKKWGKPDTLIVAVGSGPPDGRESSTSRLPSVPTPALRQRPGPEPSHPPTSSAMSGLLAPSLARPPARRSDPASVRCPPSDGRPEPARGPIRWRGRSHRPGRGRSGWGAAPARSAARAEPRSGPRGLPTPAAHLAGEDELVAVVRGPREVRPTMAQTIIMMAMASWTGNQGPTSASRTNRTTMTRTQALRCQPTTYGSRP